MRRPYFGGAGEPWFYLGLYPISTTLLLILVVGGSAVVNMFLMAFGQGWLVRAMTLVPAAVWSGALWRLVTWPLVNIIGIWFVISLFLVFVFGKEVETLLGRNGFLKFYLWLAVVLTGVALVLGYPIGGASDLNFAVFLAFAITSPRAVLWGQVGLTAKWAALILIAIYALLHLAAHNWEELAILAFTVAGTAVILRLMGAAHSLPWLKVPDVSAIPSIRLRRSPRLTVVQDPMPEIDALLDKIALHGVDSLTLKEKAALEAASGRVKRSK
jgi:Family of unknown function (DUF6576)/Rhomboid family